MAAEANAQRRKFYRLNYPSSERPKVKLKTIVYEALDISEEGIRLSLDKVSVPDVREGMSVSGTIDFGGRGSFSFRGEVVRVGEESFAVKLKTPFPLSHIMAEQRYLIQKYKKV